MQRRSIAGKRVSRIPRSQHVMLLSLRMRIKMVCFVVGYCVFVRKIKNTTVIQISFELTGIVFFRLFITFVTFSCLLLGNCKLFIQLLIFSLFL